MIVTRQGEKEIVAVIVGHSKKRPHFTGHALVRKGPENVKADEQLYAEMIASHNDKARLLLTLKGKRVAIELRPPPRLASVGLTSIRERFYVVKDCNANALTIEDTTHGRSIVEPLRNVEVLPTTLLGHAALIIFIDANEKQFLL